MFDKIAQEKLNQIIKQSIGKKKRKQPNKNINIDFLINKTIQKDFLFLIPYTKKYKEEFVKLFYDMERFNFQHTPSIYNKNLLQNEDQIFYKKNLEKVSLYEHTIRVAKLVIDNFIGAFYFEDLLLLALVHDFGKSEQLIKFYNIDTNFNKYHEEVSSIYLQIILNEIDVVEPVNQKLYFILKHHHFKRRISNKQFLSSQEESIIKSLENSPLYKNLLKVDIMARKIEEILQQT